MINTLNAVMHQQGIGVIYLDGEANVLGKNSKADEILETSKNLWCRGKQLCFEDNQLKKSLLTKLEAKLENGVKERIFVKKGLDQSPIALSLFPIVDDVSVDNGRKSQWLMLVDDTNKKAHFSAKSMADFYRLTPAETELVNSIYNGLSLSEHAESRGVKITTVRWTLDNIFSKTYTHSQSRLKELANKFVD